MRRTIAALSLIALAGCAPQTYVEKQKVNTDPLVVDEAMQQRQWEPVTAYYENGDTNSDSTGFAYTPTHEVRYPYTYALTDTGTFLMNGLTLPYTLIAQRQGVTSGGVKLPPSYTAVPPQPPSTQPAE